MELHFTVQGESKGRVEAAAARRINDFLGIEGTVASAPPLPANTRIVVRPLLQRYGDEGIALWEADVTSNL